MAITIPHPKATLHTTGVFGLGGHIEWVSSHAWDFSFFTFASKTTFLSNQILALWRFGFGHHGFAGISAGYDGSGSCLSLFYMRCQDTIVFAVFLDSE